MAKTATPLADERLEILSLNLFLDDKDQMIDQNFQIYQLEVLKKINQIGTATLHLIDGNVAEGDWPTLDNKDNVFQPGTAIRIELGYGTGEKNEVAFCGIVARVDVQLRSDGHSSLRVGLVEKIYRMALNQRFRSFDNLTHGDLYHDLLGGYPDLKAGDLTDTDYTYPAIVQYDESDWHFLLSRAEAEGRIVLTENNRLEVVEPAGTDGDASLEVTFGKDIIEHSLSFTALSIVPEVHAFSWNATDQEVRDEIPQEPEMPRPGGKQTAWSTFSGNFSEEPQTIFSHTDLDQPVLKAWAKAKAQDHELRKVRGQITVPGTCAPRPNTLLKIQYLSSYFTGKGLITGVEHRVRSGDWTTRITVGKPKDPLRGAGRTADRNKPYTKMEGLRLGLVKQVHEDPAGNGRVLVGLLGFEGEGVWARLSQLYATKDGGSIFYPEVGSEVLVGFLDQDPQSPVILGGLQSQANASPHPVEEDNAIKGFLLPSELRLTFDEQRKEVKISTPAGNELRLSDQEESISLTDQHGNSITMDSGGIRLKSAAKVTIEAKRDFDLKAGGSGKISAQRSLEQKGMNITMKADAKLEQKGNIIQTKGTATVIIKGGIVKVN